MLDNYVILHAHTMDSNPFSGLQVDSIMTYNQLIDKAKECGMKALAFTEHGCVMHNVAKKQACEKAGIKYIHAEEFYITEDLDVKTRDNYHCILIAKNYDGVKELNRLSTLSFDKERHFYYNPRISIEELENTSSNILVLTACVAGILCRGTNSIKKRFFKFILNNKDRCWLEIQPHNFQKQINYNRMLYELSKKHNLKLVATSDIHTLNQEQLDGRRMMQKGKGVVFHDEDECDLSFKDLNGLIESFGIQNSVPENVYLSAINETNNIADIIEDYKLDYNHKYPRLYNNAEEEFKKRIKNGIIERGVNKYNNFKSEYIPRILEEFNTYKHNDAIDFMLFDSDYKLWMLKNNMHYGPSRGSVSGSLIAYLIHCTDVDSVKYNLNFSRFMNVERASLADIDTDIYAEDRYSVREHMFGIPKLNCCNIITFNRIMMKAAIKDIGRALDMTPEETQGISDMVEQDENGNDFISEKIKNEYPTLFKYVDLVIGTVTSVGRHAAGIVCSTNDLDADFGTLHIVSDPRPVSQIDMHEIDSLNYVKLDLLGLNAVGLIDKTCKLANIPFRTPDNTPLDDEEVYKSIAKDSTLVFQFESPLASDAIKQALSNNTVKKIRERNPNASLLDIMSMTNAAIRPAGESYRQQLFNGDYNDNGNQALNNFLAPTLGYLVYQEQVIEFLHKFCGFTMGQADIVRRGFAKKTGTGQYIEIIKNGGYMIDIHGNKDPKYIKGFITIAQTEYNMTEKEAKETIKYFLKVIEDASSYLFSKNHSDPYSMIGYFIAWLRQYYPLQLFTAALNVYKDDQKKKEKTVSIKKYINSNNIEIKNISFGKSRFDYYMDVDNNCIYQGIESIAYCNSRIADELYELSKNNYKSFIDLLADINNKTSVNDRQLKILITLNFFSDFGQNQKLLSIKEVYDKFSSCKIIKKEKVESLGLSEYIVKKFSNKETAKQYSDIDNKGLIEYLTSSIPDKSISVPAQIKAEEEFLGYINYKNSKMQSYYIVLNYKTYNDPCRPYFTLYDLCSGETIGCKISDRKLYNRNPFGDYSILHINNLEKSEERWTALEGYEVIKR